MILKPFNTKSPVAPEIVEVLPTFSAGADKQNSEEIITDRNLESSVNSMSSPAESPSNKNAVTSILQQAGVIKRPAVGVTARDKLKDALEKCGGSIDESAQALVYLRDNAENESVKISALKMIFEAQEALADVGNAPPPVINITVNNQFNGGNQKVDMLNLLMPV